MQSKIQVFKNTEFGEIKVVEIKGEPWWVLTDVCTVLGLSNPSKVALRLDEDERSNFMLGRQGNANIINESGLYAVILRSNKPNARAFRKWITSHVLPSIRKIIDGKVIVFSVDYDGRKHECEQPFNSINELRRYIDAGGWSAEN